MNEMVGPTMDKLLRFIDDENFIATGLLIFILYCVGRSMVASRPHLRDWGLRIAVASYLAFVGWRGVTMKASNASAWIPIAFRGLLVAGLVLAVTWIVLTIVAFVFNLFFAWPLKTLSGWMRAASKRREERVLRRREEIERARAAAASVVQETPESRRAREETQRQAQAERAERARAGAHCENVRAECELFYPTFRTSPPQFLGISTGPRIRSGRWPTCPVDEAPSVGAASIP